MIPKIIHYCWFGFKEIPEHERTYINGWKKMLPEYELMFWNEQTFDIDNAVPYVKQAYESKKYAFVSDYVRMYALQKYGGIYFDTDVEIVKKIDDFLQNQFFIGFENKTMLGTGIIGSEPKVWVMNEMLEYYSKHNFLDSKGLTDTTTNVQILVGVLEKHGFIKVNQEQFIDGLHIYERDFFNPKKMDEDGNFAVTDRTVTIHHMDGSWLTEREKRRGTNKLWRNVCRPVLKRIRLALNHLIGENNAKWFEIKFRHLIR